MQTIKVKVFPPPFGDHSCLDDHSWLTLNEGATAKDVIKLLKISKLTARFFMMKINGDTIKDFDVELHDGDIIGFFTFVIGG